MECKTIAKAQWKKRPVADLNIEEYFTISKI
jgi:hypothetical protein